MLNAFIKLNEFFKNFYIKINSVKIFNWLFKKWHVILLSFYGLTPLLWFKGQYVTRVGEEAGYMSYGYLFEKFFYAWSTHLNNGSPAAVIDHIIIYPVGAFYKVALILGIPNYLIQRLFLVAVYYLIIFSIYKINYYFTNNRAASVVSVFFYTLIFYTVVPTFYTGKMFQLFLTPLFFYLFVRYLETKRSIYLVFNFLTLFIFQGLFCNLPTAVATLFAYLLALIYYYTTQVKLNKIIKDIKYIFYFLLTFIPTFLYVFLIYFFSVVYNKMYEVFLAHHTFPAAKIINIFQLFRGGWWEPQAVYNIWAFFFDRYDIITISYLLFAFIFVGIFAIRKDARLKKQYIFWLAILLIFVFLTHGAGDPFGSVYAWMCENIPFFSIFREPWAKFIPIVIFISTIIFAYTLESLKKYKKIVYPVVMLFIIFHGSIFFTNRIFNHNNPGVGDSDVLIPPYWFEAQSWSKEHMDDNVLPVPVYFNYTYYHEWYPGKTGNFHDWLSYLFLYSNTVTTQGYYAVTTQGYSRQFDKVDLLRNFNSKILPLWNVKYILDQKDISAPDSIKRTVTSQILKDQGVIDNQPDKSFGLLDIYKVSDKYFLPRVYTNSSAVYIDGDLGVLPSLLDTNYLGERPVVLFSKQNPETKFADLSGVTKLEQKGEEWRPVLSKAPTIITEPEVNFEQINPTRYIVKINKAGGPFWLTFSQNFHPYWRAYISGKTQKSTLSIIKKSALLSALFDGRDNIEIKNHYLVNGYANAWYINSAEENDFEIILEYWPQRLFEAMWFIFGTILIACIYYLGFYLIKKRKRDKLKKGLEPNEQ